MPDFIRPAVRVQQSFVAAMAEFAAEGRGAESDQSMIGSEIRSNRSGWLSPAGFAEYVDRLIAQADEDAPRPVGHVPSTTLWWVAGDEYLGRLAIRHRLTAHLLAAGGHIGYDVRPSARRQGHATAMLRASLPIAHELGITSALVTCDVSNVASRRVIEASGGAFDNELDGTYRFWLPTTSGLEP